jgi:putative ABC transport system permease protein
MWKVTIKGLLAHKLRLALTALAIVLGVTFIAGTFVLTDTLNKTFDNLFGTIYQNVNFQVRGVAQFGTGGGATRNPVPESVLATVRSVSGVEAAVGSVSNSDLQYIGKDGKPISSGGAPTIGFSFDPDQQISPLKLVQGKRPTTPDDVVMDLGTAQKHGFSVGQRVRILLPFQPTRTFTITGIAKFGTANNLAGASLAAFDLSTAQALFGHVGQFETINVATSPGADEPAVQRAIAAALPRGVEVVTGQTVVNEQTSKISNALGFFKIALLVFAFIALFVGAFTIVNTFSITVGQRTKELALLRIVGASRRQVFASVLTEAGLVGLLASLVGLGLGVLAAIGLEALLSVFGVTLPSGPIVFEARTVIVCLLVGVVVTMVSAIGPARRAVSIAPVEAVSEQQVEHEIPLRRRFIWGSGITLAGAAALAVGLGAPAIQLVGLGAVLIFIGVARLAPAVARPMSSVLGRPLARLLGMSGRLGRENSMRNPRRTAQTASALMVGLALVSAISVFGASLSRSATQSIDKAINADLIVLNTNNNGPGTFSTTVPKAAASVPGVTASSSVYGGQFELRGAIQSLAAVGTTNLSDTLNVVTNSGSTTSLAAGDLLMDATTASNDHVVVGDTVPVKFALTGKSRMRIGGIYQDNQLIGSYLVSDAFYASHFQNPVPFAVLLKTDGGAGVLQAIQHTLRPYPNVKVQTRAQFEQSQAAQVNQLLGLVYVLLLLAVIIAMIGIVNTLLLSVFERTHEIGLLRAVGMKRRQVRAMIRSESVILAIFGAVIGIIVGTLLGVALVSSLHSQGITSTVVPPQSLIIFLILAGVLGLIAASWPARRAARLDVLAAIAAQ